MHVLKEILKLNEIGNIYNQGVILGSECIIQSYT